MSYGIRESVSANLLRYGRPIVGGRHSGNTLAIFAPHWVHCARAAMVLTVSFGLKASRLNNLLCRQRGTEQTNSIPSNSRRLSAMVGSGFMRRP